MGTRNSKKGQETEGLDKLIEEITVDAYGDDEQLWAFRQAFEDDVVLPAHGFVIGKPVSVIAVDYDGNERRGLTAKCRREDGSEYVISASDVVLPQTSTGARTIAAYRRWLDLDPYPVETKKSSRRRRQHKAAHDDIDLSKLVELVALPVEIIIDHWNPSKKRYRFETFCYGPKSCAFYRAGPKRKVPGRKGMSYTEEDWVDEDATAHRGPDD